MRTKLCRKLVAVETCGVLVVYQGLLITIITIPLYFINFCCISTIGDKIYNDSQVSTVLTFQNTCSRSLSLLPNSQSMLNSKQKHMPRRFLGSLEYSICIIWPQFLSPIVDVASNPQLDKKVHCFYKILYKNFLSTFCE